MSKLDLFLIAFGAAPYVLAFILRKSIRIHFLTSRGKHSRRRPREGSVPVPVPRRSSPTGSLDTREPVNAAGSLSPIASALVNLGVERKRSMRIASSVPAGDFDTQLRWAIQKARERAA